MKNFTSYWDYSEKERSDLSRETVESLLDIELMTKGILKPKPPVLREIKEVTIPRTTYYEVGHTYFETAEQAAAFLKLNPSLQDYDYSIGSEYKYCKPVEEDIKQTSLCKKSDLVNLNSILSYNKEAQTFNEKMAKEYKKQCEAVEVACQEVWSDWHKCIEIKYNLQKVIATRKEYLQLSKGDCCITMSFLKKVYSIEDIKKTMEWFETDLSCSKCEKFETCPEKIERIVNSTTL